MKKLVYRYDADTKVLMGSLACQPSPLEPGVYLIPAHSTEIVPPRKKKGEVLVFKDDRWERMVDFTGVTYWDKKTKEICRIYEYGKSPSKSWTTLEPKVNTVWDDTANAWVFSKELHNSSVDSRVKDLRMELFCILRDSDMSESFGMADVKQMFALRILAINKEIEKLLKSKK